MIFSSMEYLFLFLPGAFVAYWAVRSLWRRGSGSMGIWVLLLCSLFFYGVWSLPFLGLLLLSVVFNFCWGKLLRRRRGCRFLTGVGIVVNCLPLVFFKYTNFLLSNALGLLGLTGSVEQFDLVLPLGISFFTFQQIAYLVDCSRGGVPNYAFAPFALFVSFWPQLIAGPIVHHRELIFQLLRIRSCLSVRHVTVGFYILCCGLFKKLVLADSFGMIADWGGSNQQCMTAGTAWLVTMAYTCQLYFDFSGYCDMAWGSALLFNIKLPFNFRSPYHARSLQDFWRRWHITLSIWLRDYLYISFGGSRRGFPRTLINVMLTFLIGGLWHGAGWTFVLWGGMHGVGLCICRIWKKYSRFSMPTVLGVALTFLLSIWLGFFSVRQI